MRIPQIINTEQWEAFHGYRRPARPVLGEVGSGSAWAGALMAAGYAVTSVIAGLPLKMWSVYPRWIVAVDYFL